MLGFVANRLLLVTLRCLQAGKRKPTRSSVRQSRTPSSRGTSPRKTQLDAAPALPLFADRLADAHSSPSKDSTGAAKQRSAGAIGSGGEAGVAANNASRSPGLAKFKAVSPRSLLRRATNTLHSPLPPLLFTVVPGGCDAPPTCLWHPFPARFLSLSLSLSFLTLSLSLARFLSPRPPPTEPTELRAHTVCTRLSCFLLVWMPWTLRMPWTCRPATRPSSS